MSKKVLMPFHKFCSILAALFVLSGACFSAVTQKPVFVRDITTISGVRENPLIGYGIVVGLKGTGDSRQTVFTVQTLANVMQRMGVQIPPASARTNNVAAVFVTASLPAFARPGMKLDVTVSSMGDAKSLEGGLLLLTPLRAPDGEIYAQAQGPLMLGGYSAGGAGNTKVTNHPTVGRVAEGGLIERDTAVDINRNSTITLLLRNPDFTAAVDIASAVNSSLGTQAAVAVDNRRIDISVPRAGSGSVPELISKVQNLSVSVHPPAKVVVNERTGTIVMGGDVRLSPVSVLHGGLTIEVSTTFTASQPAPFSPKGETVVVPQPSVTSDDNTVKSIQLSEGASVEQLVNGLQAMGASARDVVAILQAIKEAGGLQAELEVL